MDAIAGGAGPAYPGRPAARAGGGAANRKLADLTDAASTIMGVLTNRTSHRMEWIIILIFIGTVSFIWSEFLSHQGLRGWMSQEGR